MSERDAQPAEVLFPTTSDGTRSTSAFGRAVLADALRPVDPAAADAVAAERDWRRGYVPHFRRALEAGLPSPDAARTIATGGLASVQQRLRYAADGAEVPLHEATSTPPGRALGTETVRGAGAPQRELRVPYGGRELTGDALARRLDGWVATGTLEPSAADALRAVAAEPAQLDLQDVTVVVLGAASEMGPLHPLLRWGARVVAVDLPRPALWTRLLAGAAAGAGTLVVPAVPGSAPLAERAGADLLRDVPALAAWLAELDGRLVLGNYAYADGAAHVRVAAAADALTVHLRRERPDTALAFLATPTDVFAVPPEVVSHAERAWDRRAAAGRVLSAASGGRLLARHYPPGSGTGLADSLVPAQGPNYALAKRVQRWRATTERVRGATVSLTVAPPTSTRSVTKNRALAAAYAGAHRFGVEVFEPVTSTTLLAALLVHHLRTGAPPHEHPWQDEADEAAHGGLWRTPYDPRSALGLAAVLGLPALGLSSVQRRRT